MSTVRLLGLGGSLRAASSHDAILRTLAAELLPTGAELTLHGLHAVPPYNEDLDGANAPDAVRALRDAVAAADALVIGAPEYNHGLSGVLKNALDWLSRPHGRSVLKGKPVLTFSASPAFTGGVRAQQQLNETLWAIPAELLAYPQIVIGTVNGKLVDGRLVDEPVREFLAEGVRQLCARGRRRRTEEV